MVEYCGAGGKGAMYCSLGGPPKKGNGWVKAGELAGKWKGLGCCSCGVGSDDRVLTRERASGDVGGSCGEGGFTTGLLRSSGDVAGVS